MRATESRAGEVQQHGEDDVHDDEEENGHDRGGDARRFTSTASCAKAKRRRAVALQTAG